MKEITRLTYEVISRYGDRKVAGRVSLLVDTQRMQVYPVPREEEHITFAARMLGAESLDPQSCGYLVPSHIQIARNEQTEALEVTGILTGVSGLEIGLGVRHTKEQLKLAHACAKRFAGEGDLRIAQPLLEDKINEKYAVR